MAGNSTPCSIGAAAEMRFASAVAEQGFSVCLPWGHAHGYDLIVDAGGVLSRVQVKQATYQIGRNRWNLDARVTRRRGGLVTRTPAECDFDVLAAMADESIYLFPASIVIGRAGFVLRPPGCAQVVTSGPVPQVRAEEYLDAWHVLKERG